MAPMTDSGLDVHRGALRPMPRSDEFIADKKAAWRASLSSTIMNRNRDLLSRRLTRDGHCVTAANGESALALVEQEPFDLILLDLLMPGMSGYEVLERLKCDPRHSEIPVLIISALNEIESAVRCIEAGAEDYLSKPFDPVLLRARVNACLEKKRLRDREKIILQQLRFEKDRVRCAAYQYFAGVDRRPTQSRGKRIADHVSDATILFGDLVGFTKLAARISATRLVHLLNVLFSDFDRLSVQFGLEKIKTIGDAYMLAGGLLVPCSDHPETVADMALAMRDALRAASDRMGEPLQLAIGIHTGPVVSGIIGTHKFIFDVWGDTVNTASRLELHGEPRPHQCVRRNLRAAEDGLLLRAVGPGGAEGKGPTERYLLKGRRQAA